HIRGLRALSSSAASNGSVAREMLLSITWGIYATILIVVGLKRSYAPIPYFAMLVFVATIVKVSWVDLAELAQLYRVVRVTGLCVLLLLNAFLCHRLCIAETAEIS